MDVSKIKNLNIALLGIAFMLIFTGFQTMGNIQTTIIKSATNPNSTGYVEGFHGNGYTSLAIIYSVFSVFNWFAPSVIAFSGPRITLIIGGIFYCAFVAQLVHPNDYLLYGASVIIGIGAAVIWTAQGNFLTINSDPETMSRNSGIFWAMLQCSMLIGNTFVYFAFNGKNDIDTDTRTLVVLVLLGVCVIGTLVFLFLRPTPWVGSNSNEERESPSQALKGAVKLFCTKWMLVLCVTFFYTGIELTFWSGVYGTSIGNTKSFGKSSKGLVGIHGIMVGLGEMIGGLIFGILGHMFVNKGRDPVVVLGFIFHMVTFFLIFMNLPNDSPINETTGLAFMESNRYLAIVCSFTLGFGDACFNTQIFSMLGGVWSENSAPAFAIFKFVQSTSAAVAFFYSNVVELYYQLLVMVVTCVLGTIAFCWVEWESNKAALIKDNSCGIVEGEEEEDRDEGALAQS